MSISRRSFLRTLGVGTAAGAAVQWPLAGISSAAVFEPARLREPAGPIRLNSNENAYGPALKAAAAMRSALASANRYPDAEYDALVERVASLHGVKKEQVLLGCGSSELLRVVAMAFLGSGKQFVQASPTFEALAFHAQRAGAEIVSVPLNREFAHDLDGMLARINSSSTLVYICNPNNPTASITPRKDLETFISKLPATCHVLIDEAYHHFAGQSSMYASFIEHPVKDERVIVCRTFSKVYGLAGLRLGYAIAAPAMIDKLNAYMTFSSVNVIVAKTAVAAMDDSASVSESVRKNADERQEFFNQAMARMLKPIDSHANFVMMDTHHPAREIIEHFRKNNVLIGRPFPPMDTHVRISLGLPEEMRAFWRTWDTLPYAKGQMQH
jgi:histidinol-phosphate aminotransferase